MSETLFRVALPRNIERYTILKSPHIYKKHRAQYEIRTHRLLIQVRKRKMGSGSTIPITVSPKLTGLCRVNNQMQRHLVFVIG